MIAFRRSLIRGMVGASVLLVAWTALFAAGDPLPASPSLSALQLTITARKEVSRGASDTTDVDLVSAETSAAGDVLRYAISWRNAGKEPLNGAEIVDPIPPQTVFLGEVPGIRTATLVFSADAGRTFQAPPLVQPVNTASGEQSLEIPPASYTHIKWQFPQPIPPGETGTFSFRVKVR